MTLVLILLMCVGIILVGAAVGKPLGWVAIGLAVLCILLALFGQAGIHIGR